MLKRAANDRDRGQPSHHLAIIGEGVVLQGNLETIEDLCICGILTGSIHSQSKVVISSTSSVLGDISCREAEIHGRVKGNLNVEGVLRLKGNAVVEGDISTSRLHVDEGVYLMGSCRMHGQTMKA